MNAAELSQRVAYGVRHPVPLARVIIRQICMSREITIVKGRLSVGHVRVLVSCPPTLSPAQVVQYLKDVSSPKLQHEFPSLKKRYWGQHLCARGYFCGTVGAITQEQIKAYIDHHLAGTSDQNFSIDE